ncbi:hypothetical protein F5050DRAFT_1721117 [Lentinula boryana]|uniref:Uncharacterized protein n=1 Tax=Lentinula boryana TaxID=40481 RepID=A0ABQ8QTY7_9AGAR|nr:hypothetical protein F5050DRAFT_1721117 [Lentinula boryana]
MHQVLSSKFTIMGNTLLTGILFSLAFILSFRTQDSTHPLWSLILYELCGTNLGRLLPTTPLNFRERYISGTVVQFRLYISPESSDPNETLSGAVVEVIPDFCILLYSSQPVKPKTFLVQILQQITTSFLPSPHTVRISSLSIPLLCNAEGKKASHGTGQSSMILQLYTL